MSTLRAEDIREMVAECWHAVRDQFGVELEPEVELIGDWKFDVETEPYHGEDKQE